MIKYLFFLLTSLAVCSQHCCAWTVEYEGLPQEKEGIFPIALPSYENVEQLMVLTDRWVVLVINDYRQLLNKINELSGGEAKKNAEIWEESLKQGKKKWENRKKFIDLYDQWFIQAREAIGERALDDGANYAITSSNDQAYRLPQKPLRLTRTIMPIDESRYVTDSEKTFYAHYVYLELPFPMINGDTYTIEAPGGRKVTFLYDEKRTISWAIKVNQLGYLPESSSKYAYLSGYLQEFGPLTFPDAKEFFVISATDGRIAMQGELKLIFHDQKVPLKAGGKTDPRLLSYSGEDIYEIDLSPLQEEGEFFISIPSVGRSWTFRHNHDVYGEAFYKAIRGLFHQRSGQAIEEPFSSWPRAAAHTGPVYESEHVPTIPPLKPPKNSEGKPYEAFNVIGYTTDLSKATQDAAGGWYDAADWDKNLNHYTNLFDLLYAYELAPKKFRDSQLNLPESGNGIPDILDEAEYGLKVWRKSLDAKGGAAGAVETSTHSSRDDPNYPYTYSLRTRWSSLLYAAAAAQFAELIKPFNPRLADEYTASAIKAYQFGADPENSLNNKIIHAAPERGKDREHPYTYTVREKDSDLLPFLIQAKLRLFILTGDKDYLKKIDTELAKAPKPYAWPFSNRDLSPWYYFSLFHPKMAAVMPPYQLLKWKQIYVNEAEKLLQLRDTEPYKFTWKFAQYWWMSWGATTMTNYDRALLIAFLMTGQDKYREAALNNIDFMLGANPKGMSWTTGLGYVYPIAIQHATSRDDGILDPVPGITIFGITEGTPTHIMNPLWKPKDSQGKEHIFVTEKNRYTPIWRRWFAHPTKNTPQNEFTIYETMSAAIFAYAILMPDDWMPSEALKHQKPRRDKLLFGYWYLP